MSEERENLLDAMHCIADYVKLATDDEYDENDVRRLVLNLIWQLGYWAPNDS